ncbi:MAG: efflux RND transporter permease subunit, partial [Vulcanimicrobiaceae bacterium]
LSYALTSKVLSPALLRQLAELSIVPKMYGVTGMGRLTVAGGPATEFHVTLDPAALAAHGIGAADVAKAIADANNVQAVGVSQRFYQRYAIVLDSSLRDIQSLSHVMVPGRNNAAVPLSALGTVAPGVGPLTAQVSINAKHAVMLNAYALPGADTVRMAREFRARLATIVPHLPRDVKVTNFWDQTTLIVDSQKALRDAILLGALLAVLVIYLFLRNLRLTLVAAVEIPVAMAIAVFALGITGQTLNLMSVGGLAVAVGLIIDDAIVVIENIARNMREHPKIPIAETIKNSMSQLTSAMIASTTSTVVVFAPLALLTGVTGFFFRALAFTLSASLIVSLALALLVAPTIARVLLGKGVATEKTNFVDKLLDHYEPILRWTLRRRIVVYVGGAAMLVVTVLILSRLPSNFLPKMDEGQFEVAYTMPTGTSLAASDAAATTMENIVRHDPAVAEVGRLTGIDSNGFSPLPKNDGLLRVKLLPRPQRDGYPVVSARLLKQLEEAIPSGQFDFHQILEDLINGLSGTKSPIEISIRGNDQTTLIKLATEVQTAIAKIHGVVSSKNGVIYNDPSVRIA